MVANAVRVAPAGSTVTVASGRERGWAWAAAVHSRPGEGSTFVLWLPERPAGGVPRATAAPAGDPLARSGPPLTDPQPAAWT